MCQKCRENEEVRAAFAVNPDAAAEVWSGEIHGVKRWFNISKIKHVLAACPPIDAALLEDIDVETAWRDQIASSYFRPEHLDHVDMAEPVLVGTTPDASGDGVWAHVIDGIHRIARAHRDGIKTLKMVRLSPEFTASVEIDAYEAVLNDLLQELISTGAEVREHNGALLVIGGKPRPSGPDDHPLRARLLDTILGGPTVLPLPGA